ncbi:MFS transporter [Cytobacillus massiliigabonensis]|uniref:MFS transporter n=1 Tax=Cytobacillus massiliigabonensis TaxID=1871011 RepID=UPI000C838B7A|nr:MFS transporter [Cytobacillus massiliigabonensis]
MKSILLPNNSNFMKVWVGKLILLVGNHFSAFVIPWFVLHETESPLTTALVTICTQIAPFCFALPAGTFIEKLNKKKVASVSDCIRFFAMLVMVILASYSLLTLYTLAMMLFILGCAGLSYRIAFNSMLPSMVGRKSLVSAHNNLEAADAISLLIGPVLASLIFSKYGIIYTLSFELVAIFCSFLSLISLKPSSLFNAVNREDSDAKKRKRWSMFIKEVKHGFQYIICHPMQRLMTISQFTLNFTTVFITLLIIIHSQQRLDLTILEVGFLLTGAGIGNLIGVFILPRISHWNWQILFAATLVISSMGIGLLIAAHSFAAALIAVMLFDGGLSMAFVVHSSLIQAITSDDYLARVNSTRYLISSLASLIGTGIAGLISEYIGSEFALLSVLILMTLTITYIVIDKNYRKPISELRPIQFKEL